MKFQTIIVGAGSAGCVLANRLSENPQHAVLLLEAGPDYPSEAETPIEFLSEGTPWGVHDWGYSSEPGLLTHSIGLERGKLVGGCSAVNAGVVVRGTPGDYDEWAALGNEGWSFSEVLPFFRRVENDADFDNEWHGQDGYLPIRREKEENRVFLQACSALGYARVADHNAPDAMGAGMWPRNWVDGVRQSAALTYLAAARGRPNLTIRDKAHVDCVVLDNGRATGVRLAGSGEVIEADRVVLSAGAYGSPIILMRSGIGPADHLNSLNIPVVRNLPGVGQNLSDHPLLWLRFAVSTADRADDVMKLGGLLTLRSSEAVAGYDLHIVSGTISMDDPHLLTFASLVKPYSRGSVRLRSSDPEAPPIIDNGYFTHPDDMPRLIQAVRVAEQLAKTPPLSEILLQQLFPDPETTKTARELEAAILSEASTYFHPVGTCRKGPVTDSLAVVNSRGQVYGIEGLFVVDASIMPTIPAANTNLPTLMVAERCSAWLSEDH
jgi:choline dehydrogenase